SLPQSWETPRGSAHQGPLGRWKRYTHRRLDGCCLPICLQSSDQPARCGEYQPQPGDSAIVGCMDQVTAGVEPPKLPVRAPDKFTLSVNLRAAGAIGLTLPQNLIARADEVIE
ncbi:MAG: hypothetical protein WB689_25830, partial [Xanthobacteraceae bacterium]